MLTKDNFKEAIKQLSVEDKTKIKNAIHDSEYAEIRTTSYGQIWLESLTNDLPDNYDELVSDGTTSFVSVEELTRVIT